MLAKENRIKKRNDFKAIFKNSKSFRNKFFIARLAKNKLGLKRFAFVVSQKVSKKTTVRNKVRRRLSAAIKAEEKNIKNGADLVIIALPGIEKKEFIEIKENIKKTLVSAGLVENKN